MGSPLAPASGPPLGSSEPDDETDAERLKALARAAFVPPVKRRRRRLVGRLVGPRTALTVVYRRLTREGVPEGGGGGGIEWLLDNYYIVQRAVRHVREDFPRAFESRLPTFAEGAERGLPVAWGLAREMARIARCRIELEALVEAVREFQSVRPLTMAELWALPTLLRLELIEQLAGAAGRLVGGPAVEAVPRSADDETVANCVRGLRMLETLDWKDFFERLNETHRVLCGDPAGVYGQMDFETRDRYRRAVEETAAGGGGSEERVALEAVRCAQEEPAGRRAHVGYFLVDEGRRVLEERVGSRAPLGARGRRWLRAHATPAYLGGIAVLLGLQELLLAHELVAREASIGAALASMVLAVVPMTTAAVAVVNALVTRNLPPTLLPKLELRDGVPDDCRTLVAVPILLTTADDIDSLVEALEIRFLGNAGANLQFALLTDLPDAIEEARPGDDELLERAAAGIRALNARHGRNAVGPFHLFHRSRTWCETEGCWMGWERKRGKLVELHRWLLGARDASPLLHIGDATCLAGVRYVITLDADTGLPRDAARRLIGTLAHPLNRPEIDPETGRLTAGYTVLQPRIEIDPTSRESTGLTRLFASHAGFDIYTRAVSDVYQDLFGEGIYVGKGIYEVASFGGASRAAFPTNALVSHDLFEGIHGRAALPPTSSSTSAIRSTTSPTRAGCTGGCEATGSSSRGSGAASPSRTGAGLPSRFSSLSRWKIVDNLRRALLQPTLLALLLVAWLWLPAPALLWTASILGSLLVPALHRSPEPRGLLAARGLRPVLLGGAQTPWSAAAIWALQIVVLPSRGRGAPGCRRAYTGARRHHSAPPPRMDAGGAGAPGALRGRDARASCGARCWPLPSVHWPPSRPSACEPRGAVRGRRRSPCCGRSRPRSHGASAGRPPIGPPGSRLPTSGACAFWPRADVAVLRDLRRSRRPLAPPRPLSGRPERGGRASYVTDERRASCCWPRSPRRTSATSASSTRRCGCGTRSTTLERLERHRGHFLNWYDTRHLTPLVPRYVSTVDSGNLAVCLLAVKPGLSRLDGRADPRPAAVGRPRRRACGPRRCDRRLCARYGEGRARPRRRSARRRQSDRDARRGGPQRPRRMAWRAGRAAREPLPRARAPDGRGDSRSLGRSRAGVDRRAARVVTPPDPADREHAARCGPAPALARRVPAASGFVPRRHPPRKTSPSAARGRDTRRHRAARRRGSGGHRDVRRRRDLARGGRGRRLGARARGRTRGVPDLAVERLRDLAENAARAERLVTAMDFAFLYDRRRHLFHLGFNVTADALDRHHYDLLASEARLASFVAIAKGDVPVKHWVHLGRPMGRAAGRLVLLSWSATMFEYLMPPLLLREGRRTLLGTSCAAAVRAQIDYAARRGVPWGISESGYYAFDAQRNYQYRAFGVPALGFKRALDDECVVAPYASLLALPFAPRDVVRNLPRLEEVGALGAYGPYEAVDFTASRVPSARGVVVRSYMAHHEGMILAAIDNALCDEAIVRRFHADPLARVAEVLLFERVPVGAPIERSHPDAEPAGARVPRSRQLEAWAPSRAGAVPQVHLLSNGRLTVVVTEGGGGFGRWQDLALTRWEPDPTIDRLGVRVYVEEPARKRLWSTIDDGGAEPHRSVVFHPHCAEFRFHDGDLVVRQRVVVAPDADAELREILVTNEGRTRRRLVLTSYGEVVLGDGAADRRHPAFSKLFVESEVLDGGLTLAFRRRPRTPTDKSPCLVHRLVLPRDGAKPAGWETDRERFLGRGHGAGRPAWLAGASRASGRRERHAPLDPVFALSAAVDLPPGRTIRCAWITAVGESREGALAVARRYASPTAVGWVFEAAASVVERDLLALGVDSPQLQGAMRLLAHAIKPHASLRAPTGILSGNRLGQSALWRHGISGDHPIVIVRLHDVHEFGLVEEVVRAHELWRRAGLHIDLVVLSEWPSSYHAEVEERFSRALAHASFRGIVGPSAGLFVIHSDQTSDVERTLLFAAARVVLRSDAGSIATQLDAVRPPPVPLPPLVPSLPRVPPSLSLARPDWLLFDNGIGGFGPGGREYVIHLDPGQTTPAPWVNVIANPRLGFVVSESGGGYTWAENSYENRLTPWRNDPIADEPGETIYLRDEETAAVWSATPLPAPGPAPYQVVHGAGITSFTHASHGLHQHLQTFVPLADPVKILHLRVTNGLDRPRRLTVTYYAEWVLGALRDTNQAFIVPEFDAAAEVLLAQNPWNEGFADRVAFAAASTRLHGLTADRAEFVGRRGTRAAPAALTRIGLARAVRAGLDPCAALQVHVDLAPGETKHVHFLLGQASSRGEAVELVARYREPGVVEKTLAAVERHWDELLGAVQVRTPDPAVDVMLNRWLLYQAVSSRILGRTGYYQSSGAFGFRDQLQDVAALVHAAPGMTRAHLLESARRQFAEGDVLHWWHPPLDTGIRTRCSDDLVWLPFVTALYVEATGDVASARRGGPVRRRGTARPGGARALRPVPRRERARLALRPLPASSRPGVHCRAARSSTLRLRGLERRDEPSGRGRPWRERLARLVPVRHPATLRPALRAHGRAGAGGRRSAARPPRSLPASRQVRGTGSGTGAAGTTTAGRSVRARAPSARSTPSRSPGPCSREPRIPCAPRGPCALSSSVW